MTEQWISITDAAARLSAAGDPVDRSTLSRYLKQHAEALPLRREGRANLVDFSALAQHRGENIRIRSAAPASNEAPPVGKRFAGSQSDGAARKAQADAEMRELDLAERRGELTPTAEVDRAGREALVLMTTAFDRAVETEAASLSARFGWDERTVRGALKEFARRGIGVFHQETLDRLDKACRRGDGGTDDREAIAGVEAGQP